MVIQEFCVIIPARFWYITVDAPSFMIVTPKSPPLSLFIIILFMGAPLPSSRNLSQSAGVPPKRTTATIVKPPFVAIFKVRDPASRYWDLVRSKLTCPLPLGPPVGLYVGTVPTAALFLVDIDVNEGFDVRAMNLAQAVVEYDATTLETPKYVPAGHCALAREMHTNTSNAPKSRMTHTG